MGKNADLIGKTYRNGDDGVTRYRIKGADEKFVYAENLLTGKPVCAIADFVRPYLED